MTGRKRRLCFGGGAALFLALTTLAVTAAAQPAQLPRVGVLLPATPCPPTALIAALSQFGWIDGRTVTIDCVSTEGRLGRADELIATLLARQPDMIVSSSMAIALHLKKATRSLPILMLGVADPVRMGLVESLAHPGGNLTGTVATLFELEGKRFELLMEAVPTMKHLAVVSRRGVAPEYDAAIDETVAAAAHRYGFAYRDFDRGDDLDALFAEIAAAGSDAIYFVPSPYTAETTIRIGQLAGASRLPTMGFYSNLADNGVLLTYGPSAMSLTYGLDDSVIARHGAVYIDKILRGAKPGDLPMEQPSEFELVVNLKTARAAGIAIPTSLLLRATRVIE